MSVFSCSRVALSFVALSLELALGQGSPDLSWVGAGHTDVSGLALTADGQTLVTSSSQDHTLKLWNSADGGFVRTLSSQIGAINALALSPDGQQALSGGEMVFGGGQSNVLVWDLDTATVTRELGGTVGEVFAVAWSADGTRVAAGEQIGELRIWNPATGALLHSVPSPTGASVFALAFSPDGQTLAAGYGDNKVRLLDVASGTVLRTFTGHTFFVDAVAFSPDGGTLASGSWDSTARLWDVATGTSLHTLTGHTDIVRSVMFSPDGGTLATGSWDSTARLWDVATGASVRTLTDASIEFINTVAYTADGSELFTGSIDGHPRAFDPASGALTKAFGHHRAGIASVDVSADGTRLLSTSVDQQSRIWQASDGQDLLTLVGHFDVVNSGAISADGSRVATGAGSPPPDTRDPSVRLWDGQTGAQLRVLAGHVGGTASVDLSPDASVVASGGRDGQVKFWDFTSGALLHTIPNQTGGVRAVKYSPDGQTLAVAASTAIRLFRVSDFMLLKTLTDSSVVGSLAWSPDGLLLASGLDAFGQNVRLWDVSAGTILRTFAGDANGFVQSVAFSPDGRMVASGSGYTGEIRTWFAADGTLLKLYDRETGTHGINPQLPLAYASNGDLAYGRTDPTVVFSSCPGQTFEYGAGCAGTGGIVPHLSFSGCTSPGGTVTLSLDSALGGTQAFFLFGTQQGSQPLLGCQLLVTPLLPLVVRLPVPGAGAGAGALAANLLLGPSFPPAQLTLQAFLLDSAGPVGFSSTNGVLLSIQ